MQSLMFLGSFDQKLSKKNLWESVRPLGKGSVKNTHSSDQLTHLLNLINQSWPVLLTVTFCKNDTKSSNMIFEPLRFC